VNSHSQPAPLLAGLAALGCGCLLGWLGRYFVIEPEQALALCTGAAPPAWCAWRAQLIALTFPPRYGLAAVIAAVLAWKTRGRVAAGVAVLGLLAGGLGLYLYDTGWAASGVLALLLRLPRIGEEPPDPREFTA
jgi:hypothetical protein